MYSCVLLDKMHFDQFLQAVTRLNQFHCSTWHKTYGTEQVKCYWAGYVTVPSKVMETPFEITDLHNTLHCNAKFNLQFKHYICSTFKMKKHTRTKKSAILWVLKPDDVTGFSNIRTVNSQITIYPSKTTPTEFKHYASCAWYRHGTFRKSTTLFITWHCNAKKKAAISNGKTGITYCADQNRVADEYPEKAVASEQENTPSMSPIQNHLIP